MRTGASRRGRGRWRGHRKGGTDGDLGYEPRVSGPVTALADAPVERRLAAIMVTDVVGYSALVGADEAGTLARMRRRHRGIVEPVIGAHRGRIVKLMGDGMLVEFASAVDAVEGALAMQHAFEAANGDDLGSDDAPARPMLLRIGVNLGDIVVDGADIFGDGVNVASRLETAAPPGGILISGSLHAQVRGKVSEAFEDAGALVLRNIAEPVAAWRWGGADGTLDAEQAAPEAAEAAAAAGHSIAVLPFSNMSGDAEQDYFSDGISEDIITDLSKIPGLMVVARNSSFAYKGQSPDIRDVGRELGVASVLEGSVRRAGNRVRINAQLIDAVTGGHLWAERYDRDLTDIFDVQDEVTRQIVTVLKVKLLEGLAETHNAQRTRHLDAYDAVLKGRELVLALTQGEGDKPAQVAEALALLRKAARLDPGYAAPHAVMSLVHSVDAANDWTGSNDANRAALEEAETAIACDAGEPFGFFAKAVASLYARDFEAARAASEAALALNPNFANAYSTKGQIETYMGNPAGALPFFEVAKRLDPAFKSQTLHFMGLAQLMDGRLEAAEATLRKRVSLTPRTDLSRAYLASVLGHLGRGDEARAVWAEMQAINPAYVFERHMERLPWQTQAQVDHIRAGLAQAGIAA